MSEDCDGHDYVVIKGNGVLGVAIHLSEDCDAKFITHSLKVIP